MLPQSSKQEYRAMPGEKQAAAGSASPAKHDEAARDKERSRSRTERHRRSKSKSRERRRRGSSEQRESKRHRSSRKHSRSASPSRSQTRGKRAFLTRQYSPPRKRHKHSRSRSDSPAVPPVGFPTSTLYLSPGSRLTVCSFVIFCLMQRYEALPACLECQSMTRIVLEVRVAV